MWKTKNIRMRYNTEYITLLLNYIFINLDFSVIQQYNIRKIIDLTSMIIYNDSYQLIYSYLFIYLFIYYIDTKNFE